MQLIDRILRFLSQFKRVNLILLVLCALTVPILTFVVKLPAMQNIWLRIGALWLAALVGSLFFAGTNFAKAWDLNQPAETRRRAIQNSAWGVYLVASALLATTFYLILSYIPEVSTNPFTLSWSEASRYYYASLFFSKQIYGIQTPPTVLHPSRYLMQTVPFLISSSPIWLHRLWQVFLWISMPLLAGYLLAWRLKATLVSLISDRLLHWMIVAAVFLYLGIGPVYYHLLMPVVLMLWGFHNRSISSSKARFGVSLLAVLAASAWAGISRINWFPVPGSLAVVLILLEEPIQAKLVSPKLVSPLTAATGATNPGRWKFPTASWRAIIVYLLRLAGWLLVGCATAFAAQVLYIFWSGNQAEQFTTSFSSSLLWHRLLPNETFPPGILLAILVVSLPLILVALGGDFHRRVLERRADRQSWQDYHPLRLAGLLGVLAVFFIGGVIVSLKIGGGSNLHNLDAYMVILLVVASYFLFRRAAPDRAGPAASASDETQEVKSGETSFVNAPARLIQWGLALALIISTLYTLDTRSPAAAPPDPQVIRQNLHSITHAAQEADQNGGAVLFLTNRQFLTFHEIQVPLIADYERVFLMEAAMAGAPAYLERFHDELRAQRFALIISEPLSREEKDGRVNFGLENNAWVKNVSRYILCYYQPVQTLKDVQVQLLIPIPAADASGQATGNQKKNCP